MSLSFIILFILNTILCLVSVAFVTLFERKVLGYMQFRLGPNKVGFLGMFQPFADALKLYNKEKNWPYMSNFILYVASPCISLTLALFLWICLPFFKSVLYLKVSMLMFLSILSLGVYPILVAGWSSNSNYSLLGGMRALAQTISYEVSLVFIIMATLFFSSSLSIFSMVLLQKVMMFSMFFFSFFIWLISILAELNRTPFDFAEGESELVSGFNTEYSSGTFAIIFMAEYLMILFFSIFTSFMYFNTGLFSINLLIFFMLVMFFIIWTRATLPRYRYDKLMDLCWKLILPVSMYNIFFSILVVLMIN